MFPGESILQHTRNSIVKSKKEKLAQPFDLETGVFVVGDYSGMSLDEVYEKDPMYIVRLAYYNSMAWDPLHKLHFVRWSFVKKYTE